MPTPVEDYVMDPGVDPTSTFGGYAPTLNQMVSLETPNSYRGMTVYSTTAPAVTGQPTGYPTNWYAWNKRNLWINPTTGQIAVYVTGSGWITPGFAINTLDGAALKDSSVNITKILPGTGNAFKIIRVNAGGTSFEFIDPASLYAPGTFNISVITPGADGTMAVSSGGTTQWVNSTTYIGTAIAPTIAGVISTAYAYTDAQITDYDASVQVGAIASQVYYFNGTSKVWGYADTLLRDNYVQVAKLAAGTGNAGKIVGVNSAGTAIELRNAASSASTTVALPTPGNAVTPILHGFGVAPTFVRWVLVCVAAENGYAIDDEVDISAAITLNSYADNPAFSTRADINKLYCRASNDGAVNAIMYNATTGILSVITYASWRLKVYYSR